MKIIILLSILFLTSCISQTSDIQKSLDSLKVGMKKEKVDELLKSKHEIIEIRKSPWNNPQEVKSGHWFYYSLSKHDGFHISYISKKQQDGSFIYLVETVGKHKNKTKKSP